MAYIEHGSFNRSQNYLYCCLPMDVSEFSTDQHEMALASLSTVLGVTAMVENQG